MANRYPEDPRQYSRNPQRAQRTSAERGGVDIPRDPRRASSQQARSSQARHAQGYSSQARSSQQGQYRDASRYSQGRAQSGSARGQQGQYASVQRSHAGNANASASAYSRESGYSAKGGHDTDYLNPKKKKRMGKAPKIIIAIVIIAALAVGGYFAVTYLLPVKITLNGKEFSVNGAKTVQAAYEQSGLTLTPGNYVDVSDTIIEKGKGKAYDAKLNDVDVTDVETKLKDGDNLLLTNGSNICEDHTDSTTEVQATFTIAEGYGALHVYQGTGKPGIQTTMVGKVSGKTITKMTTEPGNVTLVKYNANPSEKIIALTFDDGPSIYTQEVLDVLAQYNAKATFFTIGMQIASDEYKALVKAESDAGHQVCTHTQTHATTDDGQQGDLGLLSAEEQIQEVVKGMESIKAATGKDVSKVFRAPGGNFSDATATLLNGYISAEIGWNIDTKDWSRPGTDSIVAQILSAASGDVVLLHDGGGDRTQTIAALKQALPQLVNQGYKFVTIDELIAAK